MANKGINITFNCHIYHWTHWNHCLPHLRTDMINYIGHYNEPIQQNVISILHLVFCCNIRQIIFTFGYSHGAAWSHHIPGLFYHIGNKQYLLFLVLIYI